jgi:DNA replication protein DnaC
MTEFHQIAPMLKQLRLSGVLETLEVRSQQAIHEQWAYTDFLARLLQDEVERRAQKQLALRVRRAALNAQKTVETYDFSFNPGLNRTLINDLATANFVRQRRNVLISGPTGTGKSHLAQALSHAVCRAGFAVTFLTADKMLRQLRAGRADDTFDRRLNQLLRVDLLVVDDFGLKPLTSPGPQDIYDVISGRYEKGAILLTSNRAPAEWMSVFQDPLLGSAGLDRLLHDAHTILLEGRSYRTQKGVLAPSVSTPKPESEVPVHA